MDNVSTREQKKDEEQTTNQDFKGIAIGMGALPIPTASEVFKKRGNNPDKTGKDSFGPDLYDRLDFVFLFDQSLLKTLERKPPVDES